MLLGLWGRPGGLLEPSSKKVPEKTPKDHFDQPHFGGLLFSAIYKSEKGTMMRTSESANDNASFCGKFAAEYFFTFAGTLTETFGDKVRVGYK